jgi:hypothetical protein
VAVAHHTVVACYAFGGADRAKYIVLQTKPKERLEEGTLVREIAQHEVGCCQRVTWSMDGQLMDVHRVQPQPMEPFAIQYLHARSRHWLEYVDINDLLWQETRQHQGGMQQYAAWRAQHTLIPLALLCILLKRLA